jgi:hypothetical protein
LLDHFVQRALDALAADLRTNPQNDLMPNHG